MKIFANATLNRLVDFIHEDAKRSYDRINVVDNEWHERCALMGLLELRSKGLTWNEAIDRQISDAQERKFVEFEERIAYLESIRL